MPLFVDAIATLRNRTARPLPYDYRSWQSMLGGSVSLADGSAKSYYEIYRSQPWVWAAVTAISRGMMRIPYKSYERDGETKTRLVDGDLYRLTEVEPYPWVGPARHRELIAKSVGIYGNGFVVKVGMDDETSTPEGRLLAPAIGWSRGADDTYVWANPKNGDQYPFERWRIEHYRFSEVGEDGFGISPMESLRQTLANDDAARRFSIAAFANGSRPQNVLKTEQKLSPETAERLKAAWKQKHGGVDNAFQLAILEMGLDYAVYEYDLDKAAVVSHRELTPKEVAAVYQMPESVLGWVKDANFASIDQFHTTYYQDSLGAWVVMFEETLQTDLVTKTPAFAGQFVELDMRAVLRGDATSRSVIYQRSLVYQTPNEIRALENLPPSDDPEANKLHVPAGQTAPDAAVASGSQNTPGQNTRAEVFALNGADHE